MLRQLCWRLPRTTWPRRRLVIIGFKFTFLYDKFQDLSLYGSSNVELEKEMTELEAVLALIKSQRIEEQRALSSAKDQEAIYRIQYDELTSV